MTAIAQAPSPARRDFHLVRSERPMTNFDVRQRVYDHAPREIAPGVFNVLVFLSHLANSAGVCWPKNETIAYNCRIDERQVRRAIKWLEDNGQLVVWRRAGRGRCSFYGIVTGLDAASISAVERAMADAERRLAGAKAPDVKPTTDVPFYDEKGVELSPIDEKRGQIKGDIAIADSGIVMPNGEGIKESYRSKIPTPLPPNGDGDDRTEVGVGSASLPARNRAPAPAHPETVTFLRDKGVEMAAGYGDIPLDVAQDAARAARTARGPGAIVGYLNRYRDGSWRPVPRPAAPVPPAPVDNGPPPLSAEERARLIAASPFVRRVLS